MISFNQEDEGLKLTGILCTENFIENLVINNKFK